MINVYYNNIYVDQKRETIKCSVMGGSNGESAFSNTGPGYGVQLVTHSTISFILFLGTQ